MFVDYCHFLLGAILASDGVSLLRSLSNELVGFIRYRCSLFLVAILRFGDGDLAATSGSASYRLGSAF